MTVVAMVTKLLRHLNLSQLARSSAREAA